MLRRGKSEHFRCTESQSVPNPNRNPAERIRFGSEENPCPAKKPRRKAGIRAKQGISELVRAWGLEPQRITAREPKSFGLFFRPQLSTALRSRKPLKTQGFVHFRARLRRENKMQNFLVGENQGENSQRTGENFLGPITGRTNYDKPHDPLLMAILQEVVKHEVESILRGNLFSIP